MAIKEVGQGASELSLQDDPGLIKNADGETVIAVTADEKVGIGTTTPATVLDVAGGITATSGNDGTGTIAVRSGDASQYSKISMGTDANKATIGCPGASDTFFTDTAAGDLVLRADDNNNKVHIGAGASGAAQLVVTEHSGTSPRVGVGTASPDRALDILDASDPQLRLTHTDATVFADLQTDSNGGRLVSTTGQNSVLKSDTARVDLVLQNSSAVGTPGSNNGLRITQNGDTAVIHNHGDDNSGGDIQFYIAGAAAMTLSKANGDRNMVTTGEMTIGNALADDHTVNGPMTFNHNAILAEASSLSIATPALATTDHTATGVTAVMLAGAAIAAFEVVCISTTSGKIVKTDSNAIGTMPVVGIATEAFSGDDETGTVLLQGFIRDDTWSWTPGSVLYASETPGAMTHTAPTTSGALVQALAVALTATVVKFMPSLTLVTVA